jgi:histone-lysine N-methyltransferase SETMAR
MSLQVDFVDKLEYRSAIRFCLLLGQSNHEIMDNLARAYQDKCPSHSTIKFWIAEFKRGRQNVNDEEREGRPPTSRNEEVKEKLEKMVLEDRRTTTRQFAEALQISKGSVGQLLEDLHFNKVASRFVPRFLTPEMRQTRLKACADNLATYRRYGTPFLRHIITVDETPLSLHVPESRRESMEWRRPEEGKVWKARSGSAHRRELMLTVFWHHSGIILIDFLEKGRTINGEYYGHLIEKVRSKCRKPRGLPHWFQHDNAPVHTSRVAQEKIHAAGFDVIPHPPYSPDLAPSDYCLFGELKKQLRGRHFSDADDLQEAVNDVFEGLSPSFYHDAFEALPVRWQKCLDSNGNWFEK